MSDGVLCTLLPARWRRYIRIAGTVPWVCARATGWAKVRYGMGLPFLERLHSDEAALSETFSPGLAAI